MEADSVLHELDPRAKILAGALLLGWVFLLPGWGSFGLLLVFLAVSLRASGLSSRWVLGNFRALTGLWLICFLANLVFSGGEPLWRAVSWDRVFLGSRRGLFLCVRVGLIVGIGSLVSLTTCPTAFADAMDSGLRRLPGFESAARRIGLILVLAWSLVPVLVDEAERLKQAQRARGGCWRGGVLGEVLALRSTFVPLLIGALPSSEALALAMEARGYGGDGPRSFYRVLRWGRGDTAVVLLCLAAVVGGGVLWIWERSL